MTSCAPTAGADADHAAMRDAGSRIVHDIVHRLEGSISAEHGLGSMKTAEGARYKSETELAAPAAHPPALDPKRILNPQFLF
jgi:FAD/FMN-containing dehydrogenase